jgi:hypothetical protein
MTGVEWSDSCCPTSSQRAAVGEQELPRGIEIEPTLAAEPLVGSWGREEEYARPCTSSRFRSIPEGSREARPTCAEGVTQRRQPGRAAVRPYRPHTPKVSYKIKTEIRFRKTSDEVSDDHDECSPRVGTNICIRMAVSRRLRHDRGFLACTKWDHSLQAIQRVPAIPLLGLSALVDDYRCLSYCLRLLLPDDYGSCTSSE